MEMFSTPPTTTQEKARNSAQRKSPPAVPKFERSRKGRELIPASEFGRFFVHLEQEYGWSACTISQSKGPSVVVYMKPGLTDILEGQEGINMFKGQERLLQFIQDNISDTEIQGYLSSYFEQHQGLQQGHQHSSSSSSSSAASMSLTTTPPGGTVLNAGRKRNQCATPMPGATTPSPGGGTVSSGSAASKRRRTQGTRHTSLVEYDEKLGGYLWDRLRTDYDWAYKPGHDLCDWIYTSNDGTVQCNGYEELIAFAKTRYPELVSQYYRNEFNDRWVTLVYGLGWKEFQQGKTTYYALPSVCSIKGGVLGSTMWTKPEEVMSFFLKSSRHLKSYDAFLSQQRVHISEAQQVSSSSKKKKKKQEQQQEQKAAKDGKKGVKRGSSEEIAVMGDSESEGGESEDDSVKTCTKEFNAVWDELKREGWRHFNGDLLHTYFYAMPHVTKGTGIHGKNIFHGEKELVQYLKANRPSMFEREEDRITEVDEVLQTNMKQIWKMLKGEGWKRLNGNAKVKYIYAKPGFSRRSGVRGETIFHGQNELLQHISRHRKDLIEDLPLSSLVKSSPMSQQSIDDDEDDSVADDDSESEKESENDCNDEEESETDDRFNKVTTLQLYGYIWPILRSEGWKARSGGLFVTHAFYKPGVKNKEAVRGETMFLGEEELVNYAKQHRKDLVEQALAAEESSDDGSNEVIQSKSKKPTKQPPQEESGEEQEHDDEEGQVVDIDEMPTAEAYKIAYAGLRAEGWRVTTGGLQSTFCFVKPGVTKSEGVPGEDIIYGCKNLVEFAKTKRRDLFSSKKTTITPPKQQQEDKTTTRAKKEDKETKKSTSKQTKRDQKNAEEKTTNTSKKKKTSKGLSSLEKKVISDLDENEIYRDVWPMLRREGWTYANGGFQHTYSYRMPGVKSSNAQEGVNTFYGVSALVEYVRMNRIDLLKELAREAREEAKLAKDEKRKALGKEIASMSGEEIHDLLWPDLKAEGWKYFKGDIVHTFFFAKPDVQRKKFGVRGENMFHGEKEFGEYLKKNFRSRIIEKLQTAESSCSDSSSVGTCGTPSSKSTMHSVSSTSTSFTLKTVPLDFRKRVEAMTYKQVFNMTWPHLRQIKRWTHIKGDQFHTYAYSFASNPKADGIPGVNLFYGEEEAGCFLKNHRLDLVYDAYRCTQEDAALATRHSSHQTPPRRGALSTSDLETPVSSDSTRKDQGLKPSEETPASQESNGRTGEQTNSKKKRKTSNLDITTTSGKDEKDGVVKEPASTKSGSSLEDPMLSPRSKYVEKLKEMHVSKILRKRILLMEYVEVHRIVWPNLYKQGWKYFRGDLQHTYFFAKPHVVSKNDGVHGEDLFHGEEELGRFIKEHQVEVLVDILRPPANEPKESTPKKRKVEEKEKQDPIPMEFRERVANMTFKMVHKLVWPILEEQGWKIFSGIYYAFPEVRNESKGILGVNMFQGEHVFGKFVKEKRRDLLVPALTRNPNKQAEKEKEEEEDDDDDDDEYDELNDLSSMTDIEIHRRFWPKLKEQGWTWQHGNSHVTFSFAKPGVKKGSGVRGVDIFYGEAELANYIRKERLDLKLHHEESGTKPFIPCVNIHQDDTVLDLPELTDRHDELFLNDEDGNEGQGNDGLLLGGDASSYGGGNEDTMSVHDPVSSSSYYEVEALSFATVQERLTLLHQEFVGRGDVISTMTNLMYPKEDFCPHMFFVGLTGTGKSSILKKVLVNVFQSPFAWIDCAECYTPGMLFKLILTKLPAHEKRNGGDEAEEMEYDDDSDDSDDDNEDALRESEYVAQRNQNIAENNAFLASIGCAVNVDPAPSVQTSSRSVSGVKRKATEISSLKRRNRRCERIHDFSIELQKRLGHFKETFYIVLDKANYLQETDGQVIPALLQLNKTCNVCVVMIDQNVPRELVQEIQNNNVITVSFEPYSKEEMKKIIISNMVTKEGSIERETVQQFVNFVVDCFYYKVRELDEMLFIMDDLWSCYLSKRGKNGGGSSCGADFQAQVKDFIGPRMKLTFTKLYQHDSQYEQHSNRFDDFDTMEATEFQRTTELPYHTKLMLIASYMASYSDSKHDRKLFGKAKTGKTVFRRTKGVANADPESKLTTAPKAFRLERLIWLYVAIVHTVLEGKDEDDTDDMYSQVASLIELGMVCKHSKIDNLGDVKLKCNASREYVESVARTIPQFDLNDFI